ncbi:cytochrome c3 family protein [Peteryoungia desertarenae]|nr:cytochrome c3 family protein [Peteryoungia desertarenae]
MTRRKPARLFALIASLTTLAGMLAISTPAAAQEDSPVSSLVEAWLSSPHGNYHSRSFTYWNKDGEVPANCATCHSETGFLDYLGVDGSAAGSIEKPGVINSPIGCASCHTSEAHALTSVRFPSGVTVDGLGSSATCTVCHQGRQSGLAVTKAVGDLGEDTVSAELSFLNIHYAVAAATMHGAETNGGYHYPGKTYAGRFQHVPSANSCTACHDPHTTKVAEEGCMTCHRGVDTIRDIRMRHGDFDGDGDIAEGIHGEIVTLHERLYNAITAYGREVTGTPIGYAKGRHPYFFVDGDGDGAISDAEAVRDNQFKAWTPRLLKAAYNYQVVMKDPAGYVHNPTYLLQLLHDSLESLSTSVDVDMASISRP